MSDDDTTEAGRYTAQAFKSMLAAALVLADARRQRQIQQMRHLETEAKDRQTDAQRRTVTDTLLGDPRHQPNNPGAVSRGGVVLEDPVTLAQRWAAAQQPDTDPTTRVDLDTQVRAAGVDPDQVRTEHRATTDADREARPVDRTADAVQQEGVWQDGSPEVAKAGLSYTRRPGSTITTGLSPQRRPRTAARTADGTRDLGR